MNAINWFIRNYLLWLVIILVTAAAVYLIIYFHNSYAFFEPKNKDTLIVESAKALMQLTAVAILGGWIKFLYDKATEQRRQAEKANEIRKTILDELIAARSLVEESRRKYRVEPPGPKEYKKAIMSILEARLKLSLVWHEVQSLEYLFSTPHSITKQIKAMKDYLDKLIGEYEEKVKKSEILFDSGRGDGTSVFERFLGEDEDSEYIVDFLDKAYRPAVREIRKDLLRANRANFGKSVLVKEEGKD